MKDFSYYCSLPDSMAEDELYVEFVELIENCALAECGNSEIVRSFLELSDRQWQTYTVLGNYLKGEIERVLISRWDADNLELVECLVAVAARLGLVGLFEFISSQNVNGLPSNVAAEIESAISELGDNIADPYSGM
ncbi:hypothetical protein HNR03_000992 [Pseudomonas sp. JAI111]|uniref:hypothetical protein n=1 Tax=Pseudomonas sp. JAI111 TaxID=2735913 RepID=UPI0021679947|nr:hypothetical protein [Pseudomonas sp. JAI111]MCS3836412.1 hypothetical protein [Pseudomonas sp. JAI111]